MGVASYGCLVQAGGVWWFCPVSVFSMVAGCTAISHKNSVVTGFVVGIVIEVVCAYSVEEGEAAFEPSRVERVQPDKGSSAVCQICYFQLMLLTTVHLLVVCCLLTLDQSPVLDNARAPMLTSGSRSSGGMDPTVCIPEQIWECWYEGEKLVLHYLLLTLKLHAEEVRIIHSLVTFEQLKLLCVHHNRQISPDNSPSRKDSENTASSDNLNFRSKTTRVVNERVVFETKCFRLNTLLSHCQLATLLFPTLTVVDEQTGATFEQANSLFFDSLHDENLTRCSSSFTVEYRPDLLQFWRNFFQRFRPPYGRQPHWSEALREKLLMQLDGSCDDPTTFPLAPLKCYVKEIAEHHLVLTFLPLSSKDVYLLCDGESSAAAVESNGTLTFPLIVFDCCRTAISARLIQQQPLTTVSHDLDLVEDFRTPLEKEESALSVLHRQISKFCESSKNESRPDVLEIDSGRKCRCADDFKISSYVHQLELIYSRSFVVGVYQALVSGVPVHKQDVVTAIECQCEETVLGLDMTEFIQLLCSHFCSYRFLKDNESRWQRRNTNDTEINLGMDRTLCNSYSSISEVELTEMATWKFPLFLQLTCSLRIADKLFTCSVSELPTCLVDLFRRSEFDAWDYDPTNLEVSLDLNILMPGFDEANEFSNGIGFVTSPSSNDYVSECYSYDISDLECDEYATFSLFRLFMNNVLFSEWVSQEVMHKFS
ncbi:unnamed protein product [Soboliphyme baturini]|uniref:Protein kinase domain-containing protein n=1 Tax=Soboliphyme baturini TaxID=241478 RepID=A0A183IL23_9BILA|nr:unnamed protein product [Soboliphyme baturini]